jgi:tight adherence protein G
MSRRLFHTRDRGAVVPIVALLLPVLVVMTAFAVDLGSQRALRRDLQADADVIALDLVRLADGRTLDEIQADADYLAYVNESFANNDVPEVTTVAELAAIVTYGDWDGARDPQFVPSGATDVPNAVEVVLSGSQDYRFMPGSGDSTRVAVATTDGVGVFSVGSRLASLSTDDSTLLNPIFSALFDPPDPRDIFPFASTAAVPFSFAGAPASTASVTAPAQEPAPTGGISLDALSYAGLANASIVLEDLLGFAFADVAAVDAGVASPADVLLTDIKLLTLVEASADALAASGAGVEIDAAVAFLDNLALNVDPNLTVNLGELLGLDVSQPGAVLGTSLNLFDLLMASAQLANAENLVNLGLELPPGLFSFIPGLRDVVNPVANLFLTVVEGPQFGFGRPNDPDAFAETSQVSLDLEVGVRLGIDLGGLDWGLLGRERELAAVELKLPVSVDVAKARSTLTELVCAGPSGVATMDLPTITQSAGIVVGAEPSPSTPVVDLESPTPVTGAGEIATVSIGGRTVARVGLAAEVAVGPDTETPINDLAVGAPPYPVTTSGLGLANLVQTNLDVDILPDTLLGTLLDLLLINPLDFVLDTIVEQVLNPLLGWIDQVLVTRILRMLGLGVAGADVWAIDAQCEVPKLVD